MIPFAYINEWREHAPWDAQAMVEQDLIITRIVIDLCSDPFLRDALIFRGGTALSKLCFPRPLRYSEDVDLVQREVGPIGPIFDAMRRALGSWLGEKPARKQGPGVVNLVYRVPSEDVPPLPLRIKIEINTREHFRVLPIVERHLRIESRWFNGEARIPVYATEELLGTKLRALYQRRKGRDLFDLAAALRELSPDTAAIVEAFQRYMAEEGRRVTGDEFRANLAAKLDHPGFAEDCLPLLKPGTVFDPAADAELVGENLLSLLPGIPASPGAWPDGETTMTHDPELIRHILDHVACGEGQVKAAEIPAPGVHSADIVARHVALLIEHKLMDGTAHVVHGLTEKGHALRRALHDKDVQAKIRHAGKHLGEDVTIEIILDIAKTVLLGL